MPVNEIPVIDIGEFLRSGAGSPAAADAAAAIEHAAVNVGFFQIVGHGVAPALLDNAYAAMHALADVDDATKAELLAATTHPYRGWHRNKNHDGFVHQERFLAGRFDDAEDARAHGIDPELADYFYPNAWPEIAGFREAVSALFLETQALAGKIMVLFAMALDLGPHGFDDIIEPNSSSIAFNHYPARGASLGDQTAVTFDAHSDGNTVTILHQRGDYDGLQVQRLDAPDEWFIVPSREDAFVINFGELMTLWTNDHWPATMHRVVASSDPAAQRTTIATFHMPSLDSVIQPLARWGGDTDPHYEPITPAEWEKRFMRRRYTKPTEHTEHDPKVYEFVNKL